MVDTGAGEVDDSGVAASREVRDEVEVNVAPTESPGEIASASPQAMGDLGLSYDVDRGTKNVIKPSTMVKSKIVGEATKAAGEDPPPSYDEAMSGVVNPPVGFRTTHVVAGVGDDSMNIKRGGRPGGVAWEDVKGGSMTTTTAAAPQAARTVAAKPALFAAEKPSEDLRASPREELWECLPKDVTDTVLRAAKFGALQVCSVATPLPLGTPFVSIFSIFVVLFPHLSCCFCFYICICLDLFCSVLFSPGVQIVVRGGIDHLKDVSKCRGQGLIL